MRSGMYGSLTTRATTAYSPCHLDGRNEHRVRVDTDVLLTLQRRGLLSASRCYTGPWAVDREQADTDLVGLLKRRPHVLPSDAELNHAVQRVRLVRDRAAQRQD